MRGQIVNRWQHTHTVRRLSPHTHTNTQTHTLTHTCIDILHSHTTSHTHLYSHIYIHSHIIYSRRHIYPHKHTYPHIHTPVPVRSFVCERFACSFIVSEPAKSWLFFFQLTSQQLHNKCHSITTIYGWSPVLSHFMHACVLLSRHKLSTSCTCVGRSVNSCRSRMWMCVRQCCSLSQGTSRCDNSLTGTVKELSFFLLPVCCLQFVFSRKVQLFILSYRYSPINFYSTGAQKASIYLLRSLWKWTKSLINHTLPFHSPQVSL